ncbi:hypothetical protein FRB97_002325 [Tulasnella sp. 331]|nr:hypothetical protein FRB97_002325 [Tulasnella sp. 331]KAG8890211.1 hypothetical protein FRB98_000539 [Tulasnella sp. 332]
MSSANRTYDEADVALPFDSMRYDPKNMKFRNLGPSGLRVPVFSLGGWLSYGHSVAGEGVKDVLKVAFESGVNMIDLAEGYADGNCEREVGQAIKELGHRRSDWIITTKIFFGVGRKGPNDRGLSRKHIIEGLNESLERLDMSYVDIVFAHRPDKTVPMEEVVRAFNYCINAGKAHYWATSEWSAMQIEEAHHIASRLNLISPIADQCQYNCFHRQRFEVEYAPLYQKYKYGTTVFSALSSGMLTGKYNDGVPKGSRFDVNPDFFKSRVEGLKQEQGLKQIETVKKLTKIAEELGCSVAALSLAWVAHNPHTSTVILGATKVHQLEENLKALDVLPKISHDIYKRMNEILDNEPPAEPTYGR